jgi:hypothetical protein
MPEMREVYMLGKYINPLPVQFLVGVKYGNELLFFGRFAEGLAMAFKADVLSR